MTRTSRSIDHCVLPTAGLTAARRRLTALGFTVAPDGLHPFGTANCCVYFADGTFLEPLAVADPARAGMASMRGNVFTARDAAFRHRVGEEGFSALVFGTQDASADHRAFLRAGVSAGRVLTFSRPFVDAAGKSDTASFKLAFAADLRAPDAFFFTCERVNAPAVDRSALQRHANGVRGIGEVVLEAARPEDFSDFLAVVARSSPVRTDDALDIPLAGGRLVVRRPLRGGSRNDPGLRLARIAFEVDDTDAVRRLLEGASIRFASRDGRLSVPPAKGQGAVFVFEASSGRR